MQIYSIFRLRTFILIFKEKESFQLQNNSENRKK